MKAKVSPLKLKAFELLESQYKFITPENDVVEDVPALFAAYPIEVDFSHSVDDNGEIVVFCAIGVNSGRKPKAGYSMNVGAAGVFHIEQRENLEAKSISNLKFYTTLNMMINILRNVMFQQSNLGPMKGYLLPPIDVLDLFKQKMPSKKSLDK